jgi:hypothetical protein
MVRHRLHAATVTLHGPIGLNQYSRFHSSEHDRTPRLDPLYPLRAEAVASSRPTFSRRGEFAIGNYNLVGLNDVVTEQQVNVAC